MVVDIGIFELFYYNVVVNDFDIDIIVESGSDKSVGYGEGVVCSLDVVFVDIKVVRIDNILVLVVVYEEFIK